jgi:hypothetical protein
MLSREMVVVSSEIHIKHTNIVFEQNLTPLNFNPVTYFHRQADFFVVLLSTRKTPAYYCHFKYGNNRIFHILPNLLLILSSVGLKSRN